MNSPRISIIIPVYNVENYISKCVESILAQSFKDYEVILVDDGSNDKSGEICDIFSDRYTNISAIHMRNQGVSAARNRGIKESNGEWLYFCDADDELLQNCLEILTDGVCNYDYIMADYLLSDDNANNICKKKIQRDELNIDECIKYLFTQKNHNYQGYIWTKLFKRDIIIENNIFFNETIKYNEDRLFILEYLCKMTNIGLYIRYPIYRYNYRPNSAMASIFNDNFETDLDAFLKIIDILKERGSKSLLFHAKKNAVISWLKNRKIYSQSNKFEKRKRIFQKIRSKCSLAFILYIISGIGFNKLKILLK